VAREIPPQAAAPSPIADPPTRQIPEPVQHRRLL